MALDLLPIPETVEALARRLGRDADELRPVLAAMAERGQIFTFRLAGEMRYMLAPFIVGIYEFQLDRLDAELATLFEAYAPALLRTLGGSKPALARVVPVNAPIKAQARVLRTDSVRAMLAAARSFRVAACICRRERALTGTPCRHMGETCLSFSRLENAYDGMPAWGRVIGRDEAFAVLDRAEREGLVHCTYNVRQDQMFVCNCCSCCCGFLRGVKEFGAPHLLVRSNFVAAVSDVTCTACGVCTDRCPMDAIVARDGLVAVAEERCIGCGVCTVACPTGSIALLARARGGRTTPPANVVTWTIRRSLHRRGIVRTAAQTGTLLAHAWRARRPSSPA